jgi:hypothetical protein
MKVDKQVYPSALHKEVARQKKIHMLSHNTRCPVMKGKKGGRLKVGRDRIAVIKLEVEQLELIRPDGSREHPTPPRIPRPIDRLCKSLNLNISFTGNLGRQSETEERNCQDTTVSTFDVRAGIRDSTHQSQQSNQKNFKKMPPDCATVGVPCALTQLPFQCPGATAKRHGKAMNSNA